MGDPLMSVPRTTRDSQDPTRVVCQVTTGSFDGEREQSRWSVVRGATVFSRVAREHVLAREDRSFERTLFPVLVPFGTGWVS